MKITDGKLTVSIKMMIWQGTGYSPDFAEEYFDAGLLPRHEDELTGDLVYHVNDVEYCVEQAQEWERENENNTVFVDEVE